MIRLGFGDPPEQVHRGLDGFLFLTGGSNRALRLYRSPLRRALLARRWARLIRERTRRAEALGARYLHLAVPEKLAVYADKAPDLRLAPADAPVAALARRLAGDRAFLDLLPALRDGRRRAETYLRKDSHWTYEGALVAHDAIARALGVAPAGELAGRGFYESVSTGDLGEKLDPPETEIVRHYSVFERARRAEANALLRRFEELGRAGELHRGAEIAYRNDAADAVPLRLVLFGDSCAHWAPFLLTGMLAETFREVRFVWSTSLDWDYVARAAPDILIGETAERFMTRVPDDRFDLARFADAKLRDLG